MKSDKQPEWKKSMQSLNEQKRLMKKILKKRSKAQLIDMIADLCLEKANMRIHLQDYAEKLDHLTKDSVNLKQDLTEEDKECNVVAPEELGTQESKDV